MIRRWLFGMLLAGVIALGVWFAWYTGLGRRPPLPAIDVANASPELVTLINDATAVVRQKPRSADAWGRLGMILLAHDYHPEASDCFVQAEKCDPKAARWLYFDAQAAYKIYPLKAITQLEKAVAVDEDDTAFRMLLGELLLEQDRVDDAERQFTRVLESNRHKAWGHLRLAQVSLRRGQPKEALRHAKVAEPEMPGVKAVHVLLAEIHARLDDPKAADQEYQKSLGMAPMKWADPYMEEIRRLRTDVLGQLAQADQFEGDTARQIAMLVDVVRDNPQSLPAHIELAKAYGKTKQWGAAAAVSAQALKIDPNNGVALSSLGFALSMQGPEDRAQAIKVFQRALQQDPHNADTYFWLGYCYVKQNQKSAAIDALREAVRLRPNFPRAWMALGQEYSGKDDAEALVCLRRAHELAPDDAIVRKALDEVQTRQKK